MKRIAALLLCFSLNLQADWTPGAAIPPGVMTNLLTDVSLTFDASLNQVVAGFVGPGGFGAVDPFYSVYSAGAFSTALAVAPFHQASGNISLADASGQSLIFGAYKDMTTSEPFLYHLAWCARLDYSNRYPWFLSNRIRPCQPCFRSYISNDVCGLEYHGQIRLFMIITLQELGS